MADFAKSLSHATSLSHAKSLSHGKFRNGQHNALARSDWYRLRPKLLRAYRTTCYEVEGIEVRIGERSPGMDGLLRSHAAQQAVFVTAYNPYSRVMPAGWNQRMQARLRQAMRRRKALAGRGFLRRWSEAHLIVFGDARPVQQTARRFRQLAIVIIRRGRPARLVIAS